MKILIALALLLSSVTQADSIYLSLHSYHYDRDKEHNESHKIIGGQYRNYEAFTFINSKLRRSYYLGYIDREAYYITRDIYLGYSVGIISGYSSTVVPFIFPMVTYKYEEVGIDLILISDQGLGLRVRYEF